MKTMMTKMLSVASCCAVALVLTACGKEPSPTSAAPAAASAPAPSRTEDVMVTKTLLMDAVETRTHASVLDVDVISPGVAKARLASGTVLVSYAYTGPATLKVLSVKPAAN